jgi:hypothetical protein
MDEQAHGLSASFNSIVEISQPDHQIRLLNRSGIQGRGWTIHRLVQTSAKPGSSLGFVENGPANQLILNIALQYVILMSCTQRNNSITSK